MWLIYWPWSFVWTMINDPVKKAFRAIYDSIKATLDAISKKAFAGTENDFSPTPPPAPKADDDAQKQAARRQGFRDLGYPDGVIDEHEATDTHQVDDSGAKPEG